MTKHITINTDTLQKIKNFFMGFNGFDNCDFYDGDYQAVEIENAGFLQDSYYIVITGYVTARLKEGRIDPDHTDIPDHSAYFYNGGFEITSADAFDDYGSSIDIDNIDDVLDLNEFTVIK